MANKYTDEMVAGLENFGNKYDAEIPYAEVSDFVEEFNEEFEVEFSQRSIAGKLRYMGYALELKAAVVATKSYTEDEENTIRTMCADKDNLPSMEDVAGAVGRDCKSIGGKLVSMKIYGVKKANPKAEPVKLFTPEDEATIVELVNAEGDTFIEDIVEAVGKTLSQVRGKLASMRVKGVQTRNKVGRKGKIYTDEMLEKIQGMLDAGNELKDIAAELELKATGLHSILAKKGMIAKTSKGKFWTDERKDEMVALIDEGKTRDEAAEVMDTTVAVLAKQAKAMNLEFAAAA